MQGQVEVGRGTPMVCHCDSCVRAQRYFGVDATSAAGVAVYQTTPDAFHIDAGAEHLALARLTPKGTYRWYAKCCNTQIGVTPTTPQVPFFSALQTIVEDPTALGKVRAHAFVANPAGGTTHKRLTGAIIGLLARSLSARVSGRWRETPFFDLATGKPLAQPEILPKDAGRPDGPLANFEPQATH